MTDEFDIASIERDPDWVARLVRAEEVFSFLNRQVSVPAGCVAMVSCGSGQPSVVSAGRTISAQDVGELLFVRTVPFTMEQQAEGLRSKDGYTFTASVTYAVAVVPDRAELLAFRKALLGSDRRVTVDRLRQHCDEAVRATLSAFAAEHDAAALAAAETWGAFDAVLDAHFKPVGFESGLALGPDPRVTFASTAYAESRQAEESAAQRRRQIEEAEQLQEISAKAREKHLERLGNLLDRVKQMAKDQPDASVADLVKSFDALQRGALYEGLVATARPAVRTEAILVVAGNELLRFDPADLERPKHRRDLATDSGGLRSVRIGREGDRHIVLVGARRGVHLIETDDGPLRTVALPGDTEYRGGVNAAVIVGEHLYATHSEAGLTRWPLAGQGEPETCLAEITEGAQAVRDVQTDAIGRVWLSVDNIVVGWLPAEETPSILLTAPTMVTALRVADGHAYAGLDDGRIVAWETAHPVEMRTLRGTSGHAIRSLGWMLGGGIPRLLVADNRPRLELAVLGDAFLGEYRCGQKVRWGFGAEDWIVGVNDRRDQLLTWRLDQPQVPTAGISIGRLCGRSIQDAALVPTGQGAFKDQA